MDVMISISNTLIPCAQPPNTALFLHPTFHATHQRALLDRYFLARRV
jgi:hypothetical protein